MRDLWNEIRIVYPEEFRRGTSRLWYRVMTLAVPAILLVLMIVAPIARDFFADDETDPTESARIGIVDLSGLTSKATPPLGIGTFGDREAGVAALVAGDVRTLFVISPDYLESALVERLHRGSAVSAGIAGEDDPVLFQGWVREVLVGDALPSDVAERFVQPVEFVSTEVDATGATKEGADEFSFVSVSYIFALLLTISIMVGGGYLMESVSDEKENRMIEMLLTAVSPLGIMAGKVLAHGSVALMQISVWATSITVIGPRILASVPDLGSLDVAPALLVWTILFFLTGYFLYAVVMSAVGAITPSYREASQLIFIVVLPAMLPMIFQAPIAGNPDGTLARVLSLIPFTAPATMMLRLGATEVPVTEIITSLVIVALGGLALLWVSARLFRAGLLLYGQRMSLRRIAQTLRQAG